MTDFYSIITFHYRNTIITDRIRNFVDQQFYKGSTSLKITFTRLIDTHDEKCDTNLSQLEGVFIINTRTTNIEIDKTLEQSHQFKQDHLHKENHNYSNTGHYNENWEMKTKEFNVTHNIEHFNFNSNRDSHKQFNITHNIDHLSTNNNRDSRKMGLYLKSVNFKNTYP